MGRGCYHGATKFGLYSLVNLFLFTISKLVYLHPVSGKTCYEIIQCVKPDNTEKLDGEAPLEAECPSWKSTTRKNTPVCNH